MAKTRKQKNKKTKKQIFGTYIYKCGCRWGECLEYGENGKMRAF